MVEVSTPPASYAEALTAILSEAEVLGTERVQLAAASGRILAQDIAAPFDLPRFDCTAVDGYAVNVLDWERASQEGVAELKVVATIRAGGSGGGSMLEPGSAARVFTGAPVPSGTATVVKQEDSEPRGSRIRIRSGGGLGQHVRERGSEFRRGDPVARAPSRLTPPLCALASSFGCVDVEVYRTARVGLLITGSEVVSPGRPLQDAEVYESNGIGLAATLSLTGIRSLEVRRVPDDLTVTEEALRYLVSVNDVVVTSGGVSVGKFDLVREAVRSVGVEQRVSGVSIKPGKPFFFGIGHHGTGRTAVFGLPGNPMSALVTCSLFVYPYLRALQRAQTAPRRFTAQLESPLSKGDARLEFVPVTATMERDGWRVRPLDRRASHMLAGLAAASALAEFPAEADRLEAGQTVECQFLPWGDPC